MPCVRACACVLQVGGTPALDSRLDLFMFHSFLRPRFDTARVFTSRSMLRISNIPTACRVKYNVVDAIIIWLYSLISHASVHNRVMPSLFACRPPAFTTI